MIKLWGLSAVGIPVVVFGSILYNRAGTVIWTGVPRPVVTGVVFDALLANILLLIVAAPIAAVACATRARLRVGTDGAQDPHGGRLEFLAWIAAFVAGFVLSSAAVSYAGWYAPGEAGRAIVRSHLTLAAAGLALSGIAAWCGVSLRHPLDAVACSLGMSLFATGAILLGGPWLADAPQPFVAAGLLASPLVTTTAAAGLDVLRTDVLYQVSPLAHVRLSYPAWQAAAGMYLLVALAGFGGAARAVRRPTIGPTD